MDVAGQLFEDLRERVKSSFVLTFILVVIFVNWRNILRSFEADITMTERIEYLDQIGQVWGGGGGSFFVYLFGTFAAIGMFHSFHIMAKSISYNFNVIWWPKLQARYDVYKEEQEQKISSLKVDLINALNKEKELTLEVDRLNGIIKNYQSSINQLKGPADKYDKVKKIVQDMIGDFIQITPKNVGAISLGFRRKIYKHLGGLNQAISPDFNVVGRQKELTEIMKRLNWDLKITNP